MSRPSAHQQTRATPSRDADTTPSFGPPAVAGEVGTLGPYRVVELLGRGGMGAVYAAIDTRLDRRVALKVLLPRFAEHDASRRRFLREARAAAQVSHDNVVAVYEADERDGVPYIAMPLLSGCSLDAYLKAKGRPSVSQVIRIGREAAAGLAAAHRVGLVHRDVKPANLWLESPGGRVKVLDFGLAKPVDAATEVTRSGEIVGTPAYMSPEQARCEPLDHRTDLYSLGATLYRLCAGRPPFERPSTLGVLTALATEEPTPIRELNPSVPAALAELIHQLLAKNPAARPATADEVAARLEAMDEGSAVTRRLSNITPLRSPSQITSRDLPTPGNRHRVWLMAGTAAVVLAVASGAVFLLMQPRGAVQSGTSAEVFTPTTREAPVTPTTRQSPVTPATRSVERPPAETDREIAVWVLSMGGAVQVSGVGEHIKNPADLPDGRLTLEAVSVAKTAATDADLDRFKACRGLTYLHMEGSDVTDAGMATVAALPALRELHTAGTGVTDTGLAHFAGNRRLTALDLSRTKVTNAGLAHFADCRQLAFLYLADTAVTDDGLKHLAGCRELVHVNLWNDAVTDTGIAHLKGCVNLQYANLGNSKVSDDTLTQLADCRQLTGLVVSGTRVTAKGLAKFHATVPSCEITHDDGVIPPKK